MDNNQKPIHKQPILSPVTTDNYELNKDECLPRVFHWVEELDTCHTMGTAGASPDWRPTAASPVRWPLLAAINTRTETPFKG